MPDKFAVVLIAPDPDEGAAALEEALRRRTSALEAAGDSFVIVRDDVVANVPQDAIGVAVVFGRGAATENQAAAIAECLRRDFPVFPVVADLKQFHALVPETLGPFNGFEMAEDDGGDELAGLVLETLGLQRGRRKIFISYARSDASVVATQLREALAGRWYTAFQDTISIRPGRLFQSELLQELTDSDVLLLLNSPSVAGRPYVQAEIEFAMRAGLGGLQVVWPGVEPRRDALFTVMDLEAHDRLEDGSLKPMAIRRILDRVAGERTACQVQREHEIGEAIRAYAETKALAVTAHPGRYFVLTDQAGNVVRLDVALGLPTSIDLARVIRDPCACVVYDPLGITSAMAEHLALLARRFPLSLLSMRESLRWPVLT